MQSGGTVKLFSSGLKKSWGPHRNLVVVRSIFQDLECYPTCPLVGGSARL